MSRDFWHHRRCSSGLSAGVVALMTGHVFLAAFRMAFRETFLAGARPRVAAAVASHPGLEAQLERLVALSRARWPGVELSTEAFILGLAQQLEDGAALWASAHAEDRYLVLACLAGTPGAVHTFQTAFQPVARGALGQAGLRGADVDEALQILWTKLFVGAAGEPARLAGYAARGPLAAWVRASALRTALRVREQASRAPPRAGPDAELLMQRQTGDPELEFLKRRYQAPFASAFRTALKSMTPRDRALLSSYALQGLNTADLGALYGVDRSSVARWLVRCRRQLLDLTRERLGDALAISGGEVESLIRLLRSELQVNLESALSERP